MMRHAVTGTGIRTQPLVPEGITTSKHKDV